MRAHLRRAAAGQQYAIIVGLISVVAIAAIATSGTTIRALFASTGNRLDAAVNGSGTTSTGGGGPTIPVVASCGSLGTTYTFGTCSTTGRDGPGQGACNTAYGSTTLAGLVTVTGGIQAVTLAAGTYRIEAAGAQGTNGTGGSGGPGARMIGEFTFATGATLKILVGQQGGQDGNNNAEGGGGASYVALSDNTPVIVGGGGGGGAMISAGLGGTTAADGQAGRVDPAYSPTYSGTYGGTGGAGAPANGPGNTHIAGRGGGGFNSNATAPASDGGSSADGYGRGFLQGGQGGASCNCSRGGPGGFGGGGSGGNYGGGGGGGWSGGGGGGINGGGGGGGGSHNTGANQNNTANTHSGAGRVVISRCTG